MSWRDGVRPRAVKVGGWQRSLGLVLLVAVGAFGTLACSKKKTEAKPASSSSAAAGPKPLSPELAAKTLAKVGDRVITLGEYAAALERMDSFERMRYQSPDRRKRLLDEMVDVELMAQEARRRGLDKSDETQERVRQILRDQLLDELKKGGPAAADLSEADLRAYYDAHKDDFAEPERRRVAGIALDTKAQAATVLAKALKADASAWGQLVEQYSSTRGPRPSAAPNELAGDLGIVGPPGHPRGANPRIPEPVREAAFKATAVGETYGSVVEADKKFYVIRITSKTDARARSFEEAQRAIRTALVQSRIDEKEKALEKDLRAKFPVKVDEAALEKMPMPPPSAAPSHPSVPPPGGAGALRAPGVGGLPGMPRLPGITPPPATPPQ